MKFNRLRLFFVFSIFLAGSLAPPLLADDISVAAPISAVTMYRGNGAIVTRTASFTLPAGDHTVLIKGLTKDLNGDYGVRARFTNGNALVSQVRLEEKFSSEVVAEAQKALIAQIQTLEAQNAADRATLDALKMQLEFIEKLSASAGSEAMAGNADPDILFAALQKSLEFVRTNSGSIVAERTTVTAAVKARDAEIQALTSKLRQTGSQRKTLIDANIAVSNSSTTPATLELTYMVRNTGWAVETEANLDSAAASASVRLFANVNQRTGEDWTNVSLRLSTTTPSTNIKNYRPRPVYMNLEVPNPQADMSKMLNSVREGRITSDVEEVIVTGSRIKVNETNFDAEFVLDQPISMPSDGSEQRFLVSTATANTVVVLRVTPRHNRTAYVYADAELDGFPYLTTPAVSLTRDGTYVGSGRWPDLQPRTALKLPFGATDRVKIEAITLPSEDGGSGIFRKRVNQEERLQFRITNNNSVPVTMEVFDRIPNSQHEDLKVEQLSGSTNPTARDVDEQPGVIMWRKTLAPGEVWAINNLYKISYPEGKRLTR